jgi:serine protease Do
VIDLLRAGKDIDSIGINGQAVSSEDGSIMGVWVSSVKSGSPADKTGVKAGDIVTSLENLFLARDGTLKDYCDILRTHTPEDTLAIQILRWNSQEILDGQLNGRSLAVAASLVNPVPTDDSSAQGTATDTGPTTPINCVVSTIPGYNTCVDDTGNIQVDVPDYWTDVNGSTWTYDDQEIGVAISAAPNLSDFQNYFDAEGMFFGASGTFAQIIGHIELLDYYTTAYRGKCHYDGRVDYDDGVYRGKYDQYSDCGGTGGYDAYVLGARDKEDPSTKLILVEIQVYPNDTDTVRQIWSTFYVYF